MKSDFMAKLKLRLLLIAVAAIVVTVFSQGTLAYYTTVGKATNVVTSGNIKFIIHEKTAEGNDFPEEGVYVVPGDVVSKRVSIENLCEHPFYLRVKPVYGINGTDELTADECFGLDIDRQNWIEKDGWFYYKDIVQPGETTPAVFTEVEIIGEKAFFGCKGIVELVIPDSVKEIGARAFYKCEKLKKLTIGSGIERIADYAFYKCAELTELTLSSGLKSIGS